MATPSIRGHQAEIQLFRNGQEVGLVNITKFDVTQDSSFSRAFYVGKKVGEGDQTVDGWSGSIDCEVKDAQIDDIIDALINSNLAGVGIDDFAVVDTEFYSNGSSRTYVYTDVQLKMNKAVGGQQEKMTKRLEFQASDRKIVP